MPRGYKREKTVEQMTNDEFIKNLMVWNGPMVQMFIVDALIKWSDLVVGKGIEGLRKEFGKGSMINADSWFYAAKKVQEEMKKKYG